MKSFIQTALMLLVTIYMSGCAVIASSAMNSSTTDSDLLEKTAKHLGAPNSAVRLSAIQKGMVESTYQAKQGNKVYNCTLYYGDVKCSPSASQNFSEATKDNAIDARMTNLQAQTRLNQLGFNVGKPDGVFGKKSVDQLKQFQVSKGLAATGKLDATTVNALR